MYAGVRKVHKNCEGIGTSTGTLRYSGKLVTNSSPKSTELHELLISMDHGKQSRQMGYVW